MYTIADLRKQKNVTQAELAKILGIAQGAVANWETGLRTPRLAVAKKVAEFFEVRVDEIVFLRDETTERDRNKTKAG